MVATTRPGKRPRPARDLARAGEVERDQAAGEGLGGVDGLVVGRQADAVVAERAEERLGDLRAIGGGVVDAALVALAWQVVAEIGEPQAAGPVEHEVVGRAQRMVAAAVVEPVDLAGRQIDALDAAAGVVGGDPGGDGDALALDPGGAAVVADVDRAVGADRRAVGPAAEVGDDLGPAVPASRQGLALDLDDDHRAIGHGDRAFREAEALGDDLEPRGGVGGARHRNTWIARKNWIRPTSAITVDAVTAAFAVEARPGDAAGHREHGRQDRVDADLGR